MKGIETILLVLFFAISSTYAHEVEIDVNEVTQLRSRRTHPSTKTRRETSEQHSTRRLKKSSKKNSSNERESARESACGGDSRKSKKGGCGELEKKEEVEGERDPNTDLRAEDGNSGAVGVGVPTAAPAFRTVRIKPSGSLDQCASWDPSDALTPVVVIDCDLAGAMALWEVWPVTQETFKIRHQMSSLCIPENPENPDAAFDCFGSQQGQAVADSINGLVDCESEFAAVLAFAGPSSSTRVFNTICGTADVESDVILMAYTVDGSTVVLWGETLLLTLDQMMQFDITAQWFFEDVY